MDLSEIVFPVPTDRRIRLLSSFATIYNYVGVSHANTATPITLTELPLAGTSLQSNCPVQMAPLAPGSRAYTHPAYESTVAEPPAYMPGEVYMPFGDMTGLLAASDNRFAVFGVGDEVRARFSTDALAQPLPGRVRKHVLVIHNYYYNALNPLAPAIAEPFPSTLLEHGSKKKIARMLKRRWASRLERGAGRPRSCLPPSPACSDFIDRLVQEFERHTILYLSF